MAARSACNTAMGERPGAGAAEHPLLQEHVWTSVLAQKLHV